LARGGLAAGEGDRLENIVGIDFKILDDRMLFPSLVPEQPQVDVVKPESSGQQLKDAKLDASAVQRLEDGAQGIRLGAVRQGDDGEVVVVDGLDPLLVYFRQCIEQVGPRFL